GAEALLEAACRAALRQRDERSGQSFLHHWRQRPDPRRRLIVVMDGLNEQPSLSWAALIREMQTLVGQIGGQLVLTCRPRFWDRELQMRLRGDGFRSELIGGFNSEEFATAMRHSGHDPERFPPALRGDLRNPRIFALASRLLHSLDPAHGPITKERVLWEYWLYRCQERDDIVLNDEAFREILIRHAHSAWAEIRGDSRLAWQLRGQELPLTRDALNLARGESIEQLTADLLDVADGNFFKLVRNGPTL